MEEIIILLSARRATSHARSHLKGVLAMHTIFQIFFSHPCQIVEANLGEKQLISKISVVSPLSLSDVLTGWKA